MEWLGADHVVVSGRASGRAWPGSLAQERLEPTAAVRRSSLDALAGRFVGWSAERARRREAVASALLAALPARCRRRDGGGPPPGRADHRHRAHGGLLRPARARGRSRARHRPRRLLAPPGGAPRRGGPARRATRSPGRARSAPLVTREDREAVEQAAVLLTVADDITERCAPAPRPPCAAGPAAGKSRWPSPRSPRGACAGSTSGSGRLSGSGSGVVPGAAKRG